MSRWWTFLKEQCDGVGLDSEALWAFLGVFSLTLIFELIERGYV